MWILEVPEIPECNLKHIRKVLTRGSHTTFGRNSVNTIILEGAKSISKQHASVKITDEGGVIVQDEGSKFGTFIGEEKITGPYETEDSVSIRFGKLQADFRIYSEDVHLVLSNLKPHHVKDAADRLGATLYKEWTDRATHVVATKYNTPKVIHAVVAQKWIVNLTFVRDLATLPEMPDPQNYLPEDDWAQGTDPGEFYPRERKTFKNLELLFFDREQYNLLQDVLVVGKADPMLFEGPFERKAVIDFIWTVNFPVIVIPRDEDHARLLEELRQEFGFTTITQGDFMTVALSEGGHDVFNAKALRPKRTSEPHLLVPAPSNEVPAPAAAVESQLQPQPTRIGSRATHSLATFDEDLFGFSQPVKFVPRRSEAVDPEPSVMPLMETSQAPDKAIPAEAPVQAPIPSSDDEVEVAPAAAAFAKKNASRKRSPEVTKAPSPKRQKPDLTEEDIIATIKANKERAEAPEEEEHIGGDLRNLGTVEYFEVDAAQSGHAAAVRQSQSDRWNPAWNGQKNFKAFRRNGPAPPQSIMIRLVESKPSDRAMADTEWLETARARINEEPPSQKQSLFLADVEDSDDDDPLKFRM